MIKSINKEVSIITDASVSKDFAVGAYWIGDQNELNELETFSLENDMNLILLRDKIKQSIKIITDSNSSSTVFEITTVINALEDAHKNYPNSTSINIYTDCKNIIDLVEKRRVKLEWSGFKNKKGVLINNSELYKELFSLLNPIPTKFIKIKGHCKQTDRENIEQCIFDCVDKLCRKKLREDKVEKN